MSNAYEHTEITRVSDDEQVEVMHYLDFEAGGWSYLRRREVIRINGKVTKIVNEVMETYNHLFTATEEFRARFPAEVA